jgi:ParB-like chromosome segregation protein Spo0J
MQRATIGTIIPNPKNPRIIKDDKFKKLVKSIQEFPQMLELRPIVVDSNMVVLGGNMRLKACIAAGLKEVPIIIADKLTDAQKDEFIIKDNVGFGEWDWDLLANEWEVKDLFNWGVDIPSAYFDDDKEPEFDKDMLDEALDG